MSGIIRDIIDLVYPPLCLVCDTDIDKGCLCPDCVLQFKLIGGPFCDRCGEPVTSGQLVCRRCERTAAPAYDWSQAPYQYDGAILRAIHRLKYESKSALAVPLGELLANSLDQVTPLHDPGPVRDVAAPLFDLIVPVPLHPARFRQRGFNQAEELARAIEKRMGWKLDSGLMVRNRRTPTQTAMSYEERKRNIEGAFSVTMPGSLEHKHILVVDDVLTSTSTAREVCKAIAAAGAARICVLALARSV